MKTLNMISFVAMPFFSNCSRTTALSGSMNVAIASIGAFVLSGIVCYISDLAKESKL